MTRTERTKMWSAYKRFNPFAGREARIEKRKKMLKGDENWFEMNVLLSTFGGDKYESIHEKKNNRININGNRGPWKRPDINIARDHASKWRMLDEELDWRRTDVSKFDIWGIALQSYMLLLRILGGTFFLLAVLSLPLLLMNVSGDSLEQYGEGMYYDIARTTLGNIGQSKFTVDKLNMTHCNEILNSSISRNQTVHVDETRNYIEYQLLEACLTGPYVSLLGFRYDLQTAQNFYTSLDSVLTMILFTSLTYYLHNEKRRERVQSMFRNEETNPSEYSIFVTGYPDEMRPPDNMMKLRVAKHMEQLYNLQKSFCAVSVRNDTLYENYRPHGRSAAYHDRGMYYKKWIADCTFVYRNDRYFKAFKKNMKLYKKRRRYKMDAWKFEVGTEYAREDGERAFLFFR